MELGLSLLKVITGFLKLHFESLDSALVHPGQTLALDQFLLGPVVVALKALTSLDKFLDLMVFLAELKFKAGFVGTGMILRVASSLLDQSLLFQLHLLNHL